MSQIQLYDETNIDELKWPNSAQGIWAKEYLLPLMKEGVDKYITNVKTQLFVLLLNDIVIPLTVNHREYENSYLVSNYYGISHFAEQLQSTHPLTHKILQPFLGLSKQVLKLLKINKVVIVNNWLLSVSLYPALTACQIDEITRFLSCQFPDHLLMFRNIDFYHNQPLYDCLKATKYCLIKTREVFFYDPKEQQLSSRNRYHQRRDQRLIEKEGYAPLHAIEQTKQEQLFTQLIDLYKQVYVLKHTSYSPHYTPQFFENVFHKKLFGFVGIEKNGSIEAFAGYWHNHQSMISPIIGFGINRSDSVNLYRALISLMIQQAEAHNIALNDGSGGTKTKQSRGLVPFPEYAAIYSSHLPLGRSFFWRIATSAMNKWEQFSSR